MFGDPAALARLERILHPLVRAEEAPVSRRARAAPARLVALDIPLLFETGGEARCDAVIVVGAPRFVQLGRVLARPGMTRSDWPAIEARQMSDAEKRRRADIVIETGLGRRHSLAKLRRELKRLRHEHPLTGILYNIQSPCL